MSSAPEVPSRPPSVDRLARSLTESGLPHPLLVDIAREAIAAGDPASAPTRAEKLRRGLLGSVINATGTLLHTNLGRAPWPASDAGRPTNLELDLDTGERGSRHTHAGTLLARACGAESAIVVNNCAAAVLLALAALAAGRGVVVSRGELVEIGGGFRIPDVMAQSGARLVEVGTTNRTRVDDFAGALRNPANDAALVMHVHRSNYRIEGFTQSATIAELASLATPERPLIVDAGSGLLDAACPWLTDGPPTWLAGEPAVRQTLDAGAGLVLFSGDKLLGGPQAGVIAGRADLVATCARHPLARALRPGQLVLGSLQDLALAYLRRDGDAIPFWRMATAPVASLRDRAIALGVGAVTETVAVPGGGTLPGTEIPSIGVVVGGDRRAALRRNNPPVIARSQGPDTVCDLRSVDPADDALLAAALRGVGT